MKITQTNPINNGWIDEYTIAYSTNNPKDCILVHDVQYWLDYSLSELKDHSKRNNIGAYFDDFLFEAAIPKYEQMNDNSFICINSNWWGLVFFSKEALFKYLKYTYSEPDYDPCFTTLIGIQSGKLIDFRSIDTSYAYCNF